MSGEVAVVNRALMKLGEMPITALTDPIKPAQLAASIYPSVRDAEIQKHPWHFAKARDVLSPQATRPAFGWAYQYLLPSDCLRLMRLGGGPFIDFSDFPTGEGLEFAIEGRNLLTNFGPPLSLLYLRRVEDVPMFPPAFVEVLASKLAVEMAETLTGQNNKREAAWKEYEMALREAKKVNAMQLPAQALEGDSWTLAYISGGF